MMTTDSDRAGLDARRRRERMTVLESFERQSARDLDGYLATLTDDARILLPWQPPGFPRELVGHEEIGAAFTALDMYGRHTLEVTSMRPFLDPGRWLVEVDAGDAAAEADASYADHMVVLIRMREGKIADVVSYHNPLTTITAMRKALPVPGRC
ncbi:nuclear transport factor 2 family protein [Nocardia sp. CDC159]|uniref:Nuclear transport factor 2 family protein n=1 Tax=Nocardia pulmonis TaxID=2951408 RepID=A0A9X2E5X6_9NOCA|nr:MULTISPECIES: nuclear transport factor 2 family protein [Nocardia]MCM6774261.1 nuclear transport factor 2 family protein [Nocardia pulmonis]MCM6787148.1 nuclear transport factor 2 family protein [Nocardia sp. CDC159]